MSLYNLPRRLDYLGDRMSGIGQSAKRGGLNQNTLEYTSRDGTVSVSIPNVTFEQSDVRQATFDHGPVLVQSQLQDFVFEAVYLGGHIPQEDDKVSIDGVTYVVVHLGDPENGEVYRFTTASRKRIRIHTVRTK